MYALTFQKFLLGTKICICGKLNELVVHSALQASQAGAAGVLVSPELSGDTNSIYTHRVGGPPESWPLLVQSGDMQILGELVKTWISGATDPHTVPTR